LQVAVENRPKTFGKIGMWVTQPLNWRPDITYKVEDTMLSTTLIVALFA